MSRIWKILGLIILVVACLFNITWKLMQKTPLSDEIKASSYPDYVKVVKNVVL